MLDKDYTQRFNNPRSKLAVNKQKYANQTYDTIIFSRLHNAVTGVVHKIKINLEIWQFSYFIA